MKIPIANQLKKRQQVEIALLQDEIMDIAYSISDDLVLHGGTAIWRCYSGKRFSEDLDFYSTNFAGLLDDFTKALVLNGLVVRKAKDTGNVVFLTISNGRVEVKFEVSHFKEVSGTEVAYELVDGTHIEILSLGIEELIKEKILAYSDRRFVRDLYDIFHLTREGKLSTTLRADLFEFCRNIQKPVDETILKSIVYSGIPPSFNRMVDEIIRSAR